MGEEPFRVFISYAHDSSAHKTRVRDLAERLCSEGVDCRLDQFIDSPGEGWPLWMERQIEEADRVLIVCSALFHRRYRGEEEPGQGLGVQWESALTRQDLYEAPNANTKYVPVFFDGSTPADIPKRLRPYTRYRLWSDYDRLLASLRRASSTEPRNTEPQRARHEFSATGAFAAPFPTRYYSGSREFERIKRELLAFVPSKQDEPSNQQFISLLGATGIGKTTLAAALCHDPEVREHFSGIFWVAAQPCSSQDDVYAFQTHIERALGGDSDKGHRAYGPRGHWEYVIKQRRCLVVIDGASSADDVTVLAPRHSCCQVLVTTRQTGVPRRLDGLRVDIEPIPLERARTILARFAGAETAIAWNADLDGLAEACAGIPLALSMVGSMLRGRLERASNLRAKLLAGTHEQIRAELVDAAHSTLAAAMQAALSELTRKERELYERLAVFPPGVGIPESILAIYYGIAPHDTQDLVDSWYDASLARRDETNRLVLHEIQSNYIRALAGDRVAGYHRTLLKRYCSTKSGTQIDRHTLLLLADAEYIGENLPYHLSESGLRDELRHILSELRYLKSRIQRAAGDVFTLCSDFHRLDEGDPCRRIGEALRLSSHVLRVDQRQLPIQLRGRLLKGLDPAIDGLLEQCLESKDLGVRLLHSSLTPAGAELSLVLEGRSGPINAIRRHGSWRHDRVVSGDENGMVRLWETAWGGSLIQEVALGEPALMAIEISVNEKGAKEPLYKTPGGGYPCSVVSGTSGKVYLWKHREHGEKTLVTLDGHSAEVTALEVVMEKSDEHWFECGLFVTSSRDKTVCLWNAVEEYAVTMLRLEEDHAISLRRLADGRIACACSKGDILLWDTRDGAVQWLRSIERSREAAGFCVSNTCFVVAFSDGSLDVWNVAEGTRRHRLHDGSSGTLAMAGAGTDLVLTGHIDGAVRVWDVKHGECVRVLRGHTGPIRQLRFFAGNEYISAADDGTLRFWDIALGRCTSMLRAHRGRVQAIDSRGWLHSSVVSGGRDGVIKVWRIGSNIERREVMTRRPVSSVLGSVNGKIACTSGDRVGRWRAHPGTFERRSSEHFVAASMQAGVVRGVAVYAGGILDAHSWDLDAGVWTRGDRGPAWTERSRVAMANDTVAIWSSDTASSFEASDARLTVWNVVSGQQRDIVIRVPPGHWIREVSVLGDALVASVSASFHSDALVVELWRVEDGAQVLRAHIAEEQRSRDGRRRRRGQTTATFQESAPVLIESLTGSRIAIASGRGFQIFRTDSEHPIGEFESHTGWIYSLVGTRGDRVVTGTETGLLEVWDVSTGARVRTHREHERRVTALADLGDGYFVSGAHDNSVRVWNDQNPSCLLSLWIDSLVASVTVVRRAQGSEILVLDIHGCIHVFDSFRAPDVAPPTAVETGPRSAASRVGTLKKLWRRYRQQH